MVFVFIGDISKFIAAVKMIAFKKYLKKNQLCGGLQRAQYSYIVE